ncbi:MAG: hypothetical protein V3W52_10355 [Syntrophobacteria bacterium]
MPGQCERLRNYWLSPYAGWYNIESFKKEAETKGYQAWNINGDAFSQEIKAQVLDIIRENLGEVDFRFKIVDCGTL